MISTRPGGARLLIALVATAGLALSSCSTIDRINPFKPKVNSPTSRANAANRIPVISPLGALATAEALRGQDFFLPEATEVTSWPNPAGAAGQGSDNIKAAEAFQVAWRKGFGAGSNRRAHVTAPPVMAEGRIYVMDARATVVAIDPTSGNVIWRRNIDPRDRHDREAFGGGIAYENGKLYVSSGFRQVVQLDAATGAVGWRTRTDAPVHAAPAVSNGRVFVVAVDDNLLTFDAATGAPGWSFQALTESARILAASSPVVVGDTVVASFASGEVIALRASNGNDLWNETLSRASRNNALSEIRDIAGRPMVYKGDVFAVSHSGVFAAIDLRTGAQRWSLPISGISTPWAAGDVVYVVSRSGQVVCASRETGGVYWIRDLNEGRGKRAIWSGPLLASGRLVVVSSQGDAVALDPKTGEVKQTIKIGSGSLMPPIAVGGTLYVVTDHAELVAIR